MIICIIRIILGCIVLTDNGICCQIQEQSFSTVVPAAQVVLKFIIVNDLFDYKKSSDTNTGTSGSILLCIRNHNIRKIFFEVWIWIHHGWIRRIHLSDGSTQRDVVFLLRNIFSIVSVFDVSDILTLVFGDFAGVFRDFY